MKKDDAPKNESNTDDLSKSEMLDKDWLTLTEDWQAQPYEKTDIQALLKQTKRRTLWAKSILALDVIATIGLTLALLIGLYKGDWGNPTIAYLGFGSLLSAVFVYYEIKIRQQTWQQSCDSPDRAIINAIAGCQSSIKYIKLIKLSCWFILPAVNWYIYVMLNESDKSPWPPFIIINLVVLVMWLVSHLFYLKRIKELEQLEVINSK